MAESINSLRNKQKNAENKANQDLAQMNILQGKYNRLVEAHAALTSQYNAFTGAYYSYTQYTQGIDDMDWIGITRQTFEDAKENMQMESVDCYSSAVSCDIEGINCAMISIQNAYDDLSADYSAQNAKAKEYKREIRKREE